jgi:GGDEF domain-containing protein
MAERLRQTIEATSIHAGSDSVRVTGSFGLATCPAPIPGIATAGELIAAVDAAVRRAKALGRNRVEI